MRLSRMISDFPGFAWDLHRFVMFTSHSFLLYVLLHNTQKDQRRPEARSLWLEAQHHELSVCKVRPSCSGSSLKPR